MKACLVALFISVVVLSQAHAQLGYRVTDLGTLGGATSSASGFAGQQANNAAGMIVGTSATKDASDHAFLYTDGQMFDLNTLCDLSTTDFRILTVAKTINDSCVIIGEGVTTAGQKHAFLLTPSLIDGGQWFYNCCQWVWIQEGGGWWWETNCHCYNWHGPPGSHPPCPPHPPHCWWWPLPCPPGSGCTPPPLPPNYCWCCLNGHVVPFSQEECKLRGGQCYDSHEEAIRNCKPCWCCVDGHVFQTTLGECQAKGGQCYSSPEAAKKACLPKVCWSCINGKIFKTTEAESRAQGHQCYSSEEDAIRNCKPCWWCCIGDRVLQTTWADCQTKDGQCYATQEEAQKNCPTRPCWICVDGKVQRTTEAESRAKGFQCYASPHEAAKHCEKLCWCCINGELFHITESECKKRGGKCYPTREGALKRCKEKTCWVCIGGQVQQMPEAEAVAKNLQCYPSADAAKNSKDCEQKDCWCCVDMPGGMGVANTTPEDCENRGVGVVGDKCYATEEDAVDHCRPCWCCVPGPNGTFTYIRTTEADCNARGGGQQCYQTREDAIAACAPPPGPWCCAPTKDKNGQVTHHAFPATAQQCTAEGGQLFNTEQEALANCNLCWCCPEPGNGQVFLLDVADCKRNPLAQCYPTRDNAMRACAATSPTPVGASSAQSTCWVCIDKNVVQMSVADAQARKLRYFTSKEDAQRGCSDVPGGWRCIDGKVVQVSEAECRARGAKCYSSEQEARAHCGEKLCWACIDGKIAQVSEARARARRAQCYGSREEALRHCKEKTVWCCLDGKIGQVTEMECREKGGHGYSSRKEALKHCHGEEPTPRPRDTPSIDISIPGFFHESGPRPRETPPKGNPRSDFSHETGPRPQDFPPRPKGGTRPTPTPY